MRAASGRPRAPTTRGAGGLTAVLELARSLHDVTYKPLDGEGRIRLYYADVVELSRFIADCQALDTELRGSAASRWTARGMVAEHEPICQISEQLGKQDAAPLEVVSLPVTAAGRDVDYLWISRNAPDRLPARAARASFATSMELHRQFQEQWSARFHEHTDGMLRHARGAGLEVVCNDGLGDWGVDQLPRETFRTLVGEAFYVSRPAADALLEGRGYSPLGHAMFGLLDRRGELLCILMLARWPWGFEVTYGILNRSYVAAPAIADELRQVGSLGSVLMIAAVALHLARHGAGPLVYGEANVANCRPCIKAGFELAPLQLDPDQQVNRNVVWADNPIGAHGASATEAGPHAPHHSVADYVSYALMTLAADKLMPHIGDATALLRTGRR